MIPCLRVDLKDNVDPNVFPSKALWSEDNPDRPSHQRGRKLMLDPVTLVVWSDDIDLISPSQWARIRISKPLELVEAVKAKMEADLERAARSLATQAEGMGAQGAVAQVEAVLARKGKKQGGIK